MILPGFAAESGIFTYTDSGTSITITRCSSSASGEISIPATIVNKPVVRIENSAFANINSMTKVTIPQGVNYIGYYAFQRCLNLAAVVIPSTVTQIGSWAFSNCPALASVTLPVDLTSMGLDVFANCHSLKTVTIPAKLTSIGDGSFSSCNSLTSIPVAPGNTRYFSSGGVLFEKDSAGKRTLTQFPAGLSGSYVVPAGVVGLGSKAFFGCRKITAVTLPSSVATLEYYVFAYCDALTRVNLPAAITDTGPGTFAYCPKITKITLPPDLTRIGVNAFAGCELLQEMAIPAKVTSIAEGAFYGCTSLQKITVNAANTTYSGLDGVVYDKSRESLMHFPCGRSGDFIVPSGVRNIASGAFAGNPGLRRISFPGSLTEIERGAFINCNSLNNVRFPASLATLGNSAFAQCRALANVYFDGAAPIIDEPQVFNLYDVPTTVHFFDGKAGFSAPRWLGYYSVNMGPAVITRPEIEVSSGAIALASGRDALEFKATQIGKVSLKEIIIHNAGNDDLWGFSLRLGGEHAADFRLNEPGKETLAQGESMTLQIRFKPTAIGPRDATVQLFSNDRSKNPFRLSLTGLGSSPLVPEITVSHPATTELVDGMAKKSFGTVVVGNTGLAKTFTIKNTGTADLTGLAITKTGPAGNDFILTPLTKISLAEGESTTFKVSFKPTASETRKAAIHITSSDATENPFDIELAGTGAAE